MDFCTWLEAKRGLKRWVLTRRLTDRMKAKGYEVAISPRRFEALELEWAAENPADVLAMMHPREIARLRAAGLLREPGQP